MSLNLRNILGKLILVFFLFILSFELISAVPVDVTFEPDSYYSDTKDVNLVFGFDGLTGDTYYTFIKKTDNTNPNFSLIDCWGLSCNPTSGIIYTDSGQTSGTIKYVFSLKSPNTRDKDEFSWELWDNSCGTDPDCKIKYGTKTIPLNSGKPQFSVELYDVNSKQVTDNFPKSSTIQIKLKDILDNSDDFGGTKLFCNYTITGKTKTDSYSGGHTVSEYSFTSFPASDLGPGSYELVVYCKDNDVVGKLLDDTKTIPFTIEDKPTIVDSITFNPSGAYPDTKIKCLSKISDPDDLVNQTDVTYVWTLNGTNITGVTGSELDCSAKGCKSGDKIACIVTPTSQGGIKKSNEMTLNSHFSSVKISAPYKVQVGQEEIYSATINYNGTGTVTYTWTFGDGSKGTGKSVKHSYLSKGSYSVVLTLDDGKGSTASATTSISVVAKISWFEKIILFIKKLFN